ncbi:glutaminyl-peptide cyclotransferase [Grosmannia clavigera kw1407]|uniref:Peptide hydrolase n=1 Tax=Grosmannia clavigera (strain kw1407 / UAMH 11150) TaxID=655863 RepID=F0XS29_GROCL|nr:glutaminyl-peptide cyclotransferase [Grosmannia clavigera kw1407]EFW99429.1 glutaminyl-peptide cyclotransferase [Grosmannia clavigera kw1407]
MTRRTFASSPASGSVDFSSSSSSGHRLRLRLSRPTCLFLLALLFLLVMASSMAVVAAYSPLSDEALRRIPAAGADFDIQNGALLAPILVPRVPGTPGSRAVQQHFVRFFQQSLPAWQIQWHNTTARTPATGDREVPFANLIFRRDPPWAAPGDVARLTLVAHYDTLYQPEGFLGAIDSAAPCAMLMHVGRAIDAALTAKWDAMTAAGEAGSGLEEERGVQILLLDGEEAWVKWSATDSLYGARALAEDWEATPYEALSTFPTPLSSISLFVLLDLLGSASPKVPSYFQTTHWAYQHMAALEERMRKLELLESRPQRNFLPEAAKSSTQFARGFVEDDHVPFMARGVDILHIIPSPFPRVWHTMDDDGQHLDPSTMQDWAKIVAAFVAEWMELDGFLPPVKRQASREAKTEL